MVLIGPRNTRNTRKLKSERVGPLSSKCQKLNYVPAALPHDRRGWNQARKKKLFPHTEAAKGAGKTLLPPLALPLGAMVAQHRDAFCDRKPMSASSGAMPNPGAGGAAYTCLRAAWALLWFCMTSEPKKCPKCSGNMLQGFLPDFYSHGALFVGSWMEGEPKKSFWTRTQPREGGVPIGAFRCQNCGFLEFYADQKFAAKDD